MSNEELSRGMYRDLVRMVLSDEWAASTLYSERRLIEKIAARLGVPLSAESFVLGMGWRRLNADGLIEREDRL